MRPRPSLRDWGTLIAIGVVVGTLLLGVGGRMAVWVISLAGGGGPPWTVGGTLAVIGLGAANGALGAAVRLGTAALVPGPRWLESTLFGIALVLLAWRGLQPVEPLPLALFGPLVIAYGAIVETIWRRRARVVERRVMAATS